MISFDFEPGGRFSYRIAAVCIHDDHVLLHRAEYENHWSLPGGRAELLETSAATIQREMQEELGVVVEVQRLLWVVENFFTFDARRFHELGLYYLVALPADSPYLTKTTLHAGVEADLARLIFKWFALADLSDVKLVPSFLRSGLGRLPTTVEHIVHADPGDIQSGPLLTGDGGFDMPDDDRPERGQSKV